MKRAVIIVLLALALVSPVAAGGDKVRGDKGAGGVKQEQVGWHGYERRP
jgi:hypothetical protein